MKKYWASVEKEKIGAEIMAKVAGYKKYVWRSGYYDRAIRCEEQIKTAARYIVANPLRAKLVDRVGNYPFWDAVYL